MANATKKPSKLSSVTFRVPKGAPLEDAIGTMAQIDEYGEGWVITKDIVIEVQMTM